MSKLEQKFKLLYREYNDYNNLPSFIIFNNYDYPNLIEYKINYIKVFKNSFFTVMKKI